MGRQRGLPTFFRTQNLSPLPGLELVDDSNPHGLRHGLPAVTPTGVKVSTIVRTCGTESEAIA